MAPKAPAGVKRAAAEDPAGQADAKKRLLDVLKQKGVKQSQYKAIVEAVEHPLAGEELSEDCRAMLLAVIPHGLGVPADERHEVQEACVRMLGDVIEAVQGKMRCSIEAARAGLAAVEAQQTDARGRVAAAEAVVAEAATAVECRQDALDKAFKELAGRKSVLSEKVDEQRKGDAEQVQARNFLNELKSVEADSYAKLKDGTWEEGQAAGHYDAVKAVAAKLALDESLLSALPSSLMRKPGERGPFDLMVVTQFEERLDTGRKDAASAVEAGTAAVDARATVVAAADAEVQAAEAVRQKAAGDLSDAQSVKCRVSGDLEAAKAALATEEPGRKQAADVVHEKELELESFRARTVTTYDELRDRLSAKKRKELAAAAAAEVSKAAEDGLAEQETRAHDKQAEEGTPIVDDTLETKALEAGA